MPQSPFELEVHPGTTPNITVIAPRGPLVLEHIFRFQDAWKSAPGDALIIDLSAVPYMDSAAIGSLVNVHVSCTNRKHKLGLAGASVRLKQTLAVTRVDSLFTFYPDVEQAETALSAKATTA